MTPTTRLSITAGVATLLAAVPLARAFDRPTWLGYAALAVVIVIGLGLAARAVRLPGWLVVVVQLLGLVFFQAIAFAGEDAWGHVIPSDDSFWTFGAQIESGFRDAQFLAPPVPDEAGMMLLAALGIALAAIVVDIVAATLQRAAVAGLPLLALYAIAVSISPGVSWLEFTFAAIGYLLLLAVEEHDRMSRWGRRTADEATAPGEFRTPRPVAAGRIGITALAIAIVLPLLIPGVSGNLLAQIGRGPDSGSGGTGHRGNRIDPFAGFIGSLTSDKVTTLLTIKSSVPDPYYLRTSVLDAYTSTGWIESDRARQGSSGPAGADPGLANLAKTPGATRTVAASIAIDAYAGDAIPVYYDTSSVRGLPGSLQSHQGLGELSSSTALHPGQHYTFQATDPRPSRALLEASAPLSHSDPMWRTWTQLPAVSPKVTQITRKVTDPAGTPYDKAVALYHYFRDTGGFTYELQAPAGSKDPLLNFLTKKTGFCEQYASAMAAMLRISGVPARVVLGYTDPASSRQPGGDRRVTNLDAHAWVEAYFAGVGWAPFDPTPLTDGRGQGTTYLADPNQPAPGPTSIAPSTSAPTGAPSTHPQGPVVPTGGGTGSGSSGGAGLVPLWLLGVIGGIVVLAVLGAAPGLVRRGSRRRRIALAGGADAVAAARAAWTEVVATALDCGVRLRSVDSPRAAAASLRAGGGGGIGRLDRPAAASVTLIALAEERARYSATPGVDGHLPTAVRAAITGLTARLSGRQRLRAAVLPPSMIRAAAYAVEEYRLALRRLAAAILHPRRWPTPGR